MRKLTQEDRLFWCHLVEQLVARRWLLKLTQQQAAQRIGVDNQTLSRWERLLHVPNPFLLRCWCQALGVSLTTIVSEPAQAPWLQPSDMSRARRAWT